MQIGLLTSVPRTVDAFFGPWIDRWRALGHTVTVASGPDPAGGELSSVDTLIPGLTQSPRWGVWNAREGLRDWRRRGDLDVILTNTATASAVVRSTDVGCPIVYFCHGLHWSGAGGGLPSRAARGVEKLLLRRTTAVITMNQHDRDWFAAEAPDTPSLHLRAGIGLDLEDWPLRDHQPPAPDAPLRLVWIGDFSVRKRPHDAVAVRARLEAAGHPASLVMVGDGPLFDEVRGSELARNGVEFAGRTRSLPQLQSADILVHTASWEGLSRVLLEAAATGVPSFGYSVKGVLDCPGTITAGGAGDVGALTSSVLAWIDAGAPAVEVDRSALDWRVAHGQVSNLLTETARSWQGPMSSGSQL